MSHREKKSAMNELREAYEDKIKVLDSDSIMKEAEAYNNQRRMLNEDLSSESYVR